MNDFIRALPPTVLTGVGLIIPLIINDILAKQPQSSKIISLIVCLSSVWIGFLLNIEYGKYISYNTLATLLALALLTVISILMTRAVAERSGIIQLYLFSAILLLLSFAASNLTALSGKKLFIFQDDVTALSFHTDQTIQAHLTRTVTGASIFILNDDDFQKINTITIHKSNSELKIDIGQVYYNLEPRAGGLFWSNTK